MEHRALLLSPFFEVQRVPTVVEAVRKRLERPVAIASAEVTRSEDASRQKRIEERRVDDVSIRLEFPLGAPPASMGTDVGFPSGVAFVEGLAPDVSLVFGVFPEDLESLEEPARLRAFVTGADAAEVERLLDLVAEEIEMLGAEVWSLAVQNVFTFLQDELGTLAPRDENGFSLRLVTSIFDDTVSVRDDGSVHACLSLIEVRDGLIVDLREQDVALVAARAGNTGDARAITLLRTWVRVVPELVGCAASSWPDELLRPEFFCDPQVLDELETTDPAELGDAVQTALRSRFAARLTKTVSPGELEFSAVVGPDAVSVQFAEPVSSPAESRYWATLVSRSSPDEAYQDYVFVEDQATELRVPLPPIGGEVELRLHADYPARPHCIVARRTLVVPGRAAPSKPPAFACSSRAAPESQLKIDFADAVQSPPESRVWICVAPAWSEDSTFGDWQYVPDGATAMVLVVPPVSGAYEVRLHSHHPRFAFRVEQRKPLDVS